MQIVIMQPSVYIIGLDVCSSEEGQVYKLCRRYRTVNVTHSTVFHTYLPLAPSPWGSRGRSSPHAN